MTQQQVSKARVVVEATAEAATRFVSTLFKTIICESVDQRGVCRIALSGGTTPHALYQQLAAEGAHGEVPWGRTELFFGDERNVPHDHVESNYRMAQRTLLDHVPIEPTRIHPMPADAADLPAAAAEYEAIVRNALPPDKNGIPRFDIILLGMGGDGHVASLFPLTEALDERKRLVTAYFVPVLGRQRMTFTYPLINAARNVVFLVTGDDKAEAVQKTLQGGPDIRHQLPAAGVCPTDGVLFLVLDAQAASRTGLRPS